MKLGMLCKNKNKTERGGKCREKDLQHIPNLRAKNNFIDMIVKNNKNTVDPWMFHACLSVLNRLPFSFIDHFGLKSGDSHSWRLPFVNGESEVIFYITTLGLCHGPPSTESLQKRRTDTIFDAFRCRRRCSFSHRLVSVGWQRDLLW